VGTKIWGEKKKLPLRKGVIREKTQINIIREGKKYGGGGSIINVSGKKIWTQYAF